MAARRKSLAGFDKICRVPGHPFAQLSEISQIYLAPLTFARKFRMLEHNPTKSKRQEGDSMRAASAMMNDTCAAVSAAAQSFCSNLSLNLDASLLASIIISAGLALISLLGLHRRQRTCRSLP
jgi:hypothetical protein